MSSSKQLLAPFSKQLLVPFSKQLLVSSTKQLLVSSSKQLLVPSSMKCICCVKSLGFVRWYNENWSDGLELGTDQSEIS